MLRSFRNAAARVRKAPRERVSDKSTAGQFQTRGMPHLEGLICPRSRLASRVSSLVFKNISISI
jgi:hypothetical protein